MLEFLDVSFISEIISYSSQLCATYNLNTWSISLTITDKQQ